MSMKPESNRTAQAPPADRAEFLKHIQSSDAGERYAAWRGAGPQGAEAIAPLGELMASSDKGVAKAAGGAMETIAHHAARPGAGKEAQAAAAELMLLAQPKHPRMVRSEALNLLGMVGDSRVVPGLAELLSDPEVGEDARLALERIPGRAAQSALAKAAKNGDADLRPKIEQSLRNRSLTAKTVGIRP